MKTYFHWNCNTIDDSKDDDVAIPQQLIRIVKLDYGFLLFGFIDGLQRCQETLLLAEGARFSYYHTVVVVFLLFLN